MAAIRLWATCFLIASALWLTACTSPDRRVEPRDYPEPRTGAAVKPGPTEDPAASPGEGSYEQGETHKWRRSPPSEDPLVDKPAIEPLPGRLSPAKKQEIGRQALLHLQRMIISSDERIEVDGGHENTTAARDELATRLSELDYYLVASSEHLSYDASEASQRRFRSANDCNLVFLLQGEAEQFDRLGNFYLYQAELKGKVINLTTHQEIASKTIFRKGERTLDPVAAGENALELAAADVATYLTDEISRKWEATTLIRMKVVITDIDHAQELDDVRIGLQRRHGIYYVSVEQWDKVSDRAVLEVLCRFDVREYLVGYVDELRGGRVQVERVERGRQIKADQDLVD